MSDFHFPSFNNIAFKQVPQHEDCESLSSELKEVESLQSCSRCSRSSRVYPVVIACIALATAAILGALFGGRLFLGTDRLCIERVSKYSPLLHDLDISLSNRHFNGSLMHENVYRQPGSPEVDAAWEALGVDYRAAVVPSSLAAKSGLLKSQVQVSPQHGGGYLANVEGLHHLHCLNLLRQGLYFNYPYYAAKGAGAFKNDADILRFHVTHCLDILRQQLMCTVDIGVLGQVWWNREVPTAFPDFNTQHTCRNFDAVREWAEKHQAPKVEDLPLDYLLPPKIEDVLESMP